MRFHRAATLTLSVTAMLASGCWQGDRLLGYVSTAAQDDSVEAGTSDGGGDATSDSDAQILPCVDSRAYPGEGILKTDISDVSDMVVNGDAVSIDGVLRLANATMMISSGSVFFPTPISFDSNTSVFAHFAVRISGGQGEQGGDGLAFVMQSSPAGAMALGKSGEDLGYGGLLPSVAIELDTFHNPTDPPGQHVALLADGDTTRHIAYTVTPFNFNDGVLRYVWIDYDGGQNELEVYISPDSVRPDTPLLMQTGFDFSTSLGSEIYLGISASTGGNRNDHDLVGQAWFVTSPRPKCR